MAHILISSHVHSTTPDFVALLENERVFLDVGTLLRAVLFRESHSARITEHIEVTRHATAVISPYVRDKALAVVTEHYPALKVTFFAGYLDLLKRKLLEIVPDGDLSALPTEAALHDPDDDARVLASAFSSRCTFLATLDEEFARVAANYIRILSPCEPEYSILLGAQTRLPPIYTGSQEGMLLMLVLPQEGSTNYTLQGGRRYVFSTNRGVACWLNEETWQYEIGIADRRDPLIRFAEVARGEEALVGLSFDLDKGCVFATLSLSGQRLEIKQLSPKLLPANIGSEWSILGRGDTGSFQGNWRGVLSSAKFVGPQGLKYAALNKSFFLPLDAQRFKLEDATVNPSLVLVPEKSIRRDGVL